MRHSHEPLRQPIHRCTCRDQTEPEADEREDGERAHSRVQEPTETEPDGQVGGERNTQAEQITEARTVSAHTGGLVTQNTVCGPPSRATPPVVSPDGVRSHRREGHAESDIRAATIPAAATLPQGHRPSLHPMTCDKAARAQIHKGDRDGRNGQVDDPTGRHDRGAPIEGGRRDVPPRSDTLRRRSGCAIPFDHLAEWDRGSATTTCRHHPRAVSKITNVCFVRYAGPAAPGRWPGRPPHDGAPAAPARRARRAAGRSRRPTGRPPGRR